MTDNMNGSQRDNDNYRESNPIQPYGSEQNLQNTGSAGQSGNIDGGYNAGHCIDYSNPAYVSPTPAYGNGQNTRQQKQDVTGLGVGSVVCSLLSFCCCGVPAIIGLILGIIGLSRKKADVLCIIGVVLNAIVLVFVISIFVYSVLIGAQLVQNPEYMTDMYDMLEQYGYQV